MLFSSSPSLFSRLNLCWGRKEGLNPDWSMSVAAASRITLAPMLGRAAHPHPLISLLPTAVFVNKHMPPGISNRNVLVLNFSKLNLKGRNEIN